MVSMGILLKHEALVISVLLNLLLNKIEYWCSLSLHVVITLITKYLYNHSMFLGCHRCVGECVTAITGHSLSRKSLAVTYVAVGWNAITGT